jgi:hypothetical protein
MGCGHDTWQPRCPAQRLDRSGEQNLAGVTILDARHPKGFETVADLIKAAKAKPGAMIGIKPTRQPRPRRVAADQSHGPARRQGAQPPLSRHEATRFRETGVCTKSHTKVVQDRHRCLHGRRREAAVVHDVVIADQYGQHQESDT